MSLSRATKAIGIAVFTLTLCHCGPVTKQVVSIRREAYEANEYKQTKPESGAPTEVAEPEVPSKKKTGSSKKASPAPQPTKPSETVTVELYPQMTVLPPNFTATVQACTNQGMLSVDSLGQPVMEQIPLIPEGYWIEKIAITNDTKHVIRMSSAVIKLFDPSASQYDYLGYDELGAILQSVRGCSSTMQATAQLKLIPLLNRNVEIVPRTTFTGYLVFRPADYNVKDLKKKLVGLWKLGLYEIPIVVGKAGDVVETADFNIRTRVIRKECTVEYPSYFEYTTNQNGRERDCRDEQ